MFVVCWEIIVNILESLMVVLFIQNRLTEKKEPSSRLLFVAAPTLILASATTICNFCQVPSQYTQLAIFCLTLVYSFIFFENTVLEQLLCNFTACVVSVLADNMTFWIGGYVFPNQLQSFLVGGNARYFSTILYLLCTFGLVMLLMHLPRNNMDAGAGYNALILAVAGGTVITGNYLLDVIIYISDSVQSQEIRTKLNMVTLVVFVLLVFMLYTLGEMGKNYWNVQRLEKQLHQESLERRELENVGTTTYVLRQWKHEIHHHLSVLSDLNEKKKYDELSEYLKQMNASQPEKQFLVTTGNVVLDSILSTYAARIRSKGIQLRMKAFMPREQVLTDFELVGLLGNALDNALEACLKCPDVANTYISCGISPIKHMLYIRIQNSSDGHYKYHHDTLVSTKEEKGHGLGLQRMQQIVNDCGGMFDVTAEKDNFEILFVIPMVKTENL